MGVTHWYRILLGISRYVVFMYEYREGENGITTSLDVTLDTFCYFSNVQ